MTNKNLKITALCLGVVFAGLLTYNMTHPYDNTQDGDSKSTAASSDTYSDEVVVEDTVVTEDDDITLPSDQTDVLLEKYAGNQLANGAQPYRALYGSNKSSGTSEIKVTAPTDADVIVMVKNGSDKVVRHAYIRSSRTYKFHVSAGTYQVFFISGKDWCPEIEAPNGQMGYFLSSVSITKDDSFYMDDYQSLTYTLQSMYNGNFMPDHSNANEAF